MGPTGQRALGLAQQVVAPVGAHDGLGDAAGAALEQERHAVGEAEQLDRLVGGPAPAVGEADLHLERVAAVHLGRAGHRGDEVVVALDLLDALLGAARRGSAPARAPAPPSPAPCPRRRPSPAFFAGFMPAESRSSCAFSSPALALALDHVQEADQALLHQLVADRAQAVRGRAHELGLGDGLVQLLGHARGSRRGRAACTAFLPQGTLARISLAAWAETRLNAVCRKPRTSWLFDSRAMSMSAPSSTPCGMRLDLDRLLGQLGGGAREGQRLVARAGRRSCAGPRPPAACSGCVACGLARAVCST